MLPAWVGCYRSSAEYVVNLYGVTGLQGVMGTGHAGVCRARFHLPLTYPSKRNPIQNLAVSVARILMNLSPACSAFLWKWMLQRFISVKGGAVANWIEPPRASPIWRETVDQIRHFQCLCEGRLPRFNLITRLYRRVRALQRKQKDSR